MIRVGDRPQCEADWKLATELVLGLTSRAFCVPIEGLSVRNRSARHIAYARQVAMYLMHVTFGGTYQDTGKALGRERTTVAYACSLIEDDRDDVRFDNKLSELEECIARLWYVERLRTVKKPGEGRGRAAA